jgi:hypothetical protein
MAATSVDPTLIGSGVGVAAPGDINAIFLNPANAAAIDNWSVTSMYTSLLEGDINYTMLGGAYKSPQYGNFGLAYLGGGSTGISGTTLDANSRVAPTGSSFDYSNSTISLVYGKTIQPKLAAGGTLKMFSKGFGSQGSGSGFNLDLGLVYDVQKDLTAGLVIQNSLPMGINWTTGASENTPMLIKGGVNYKLREDITLATDIDLAPFVLHGGIEWMPMPMLAVRGGIENLTSGMNLSLGLGLVYKGIRFDYAYLKDGTLDANSTHFFTFSYSPIPLKKEIVKEPVIAQPKVETPVSIKQLEKPVTKKKK